uniref:Uncharacterized protein n=1 Tax=Caulobacter phage BL57 TaxID=3348355 RepID=A0AB74UNH3_9VIRU
MKAPETSEASEAIGEAMRQAQARAQPQLDRALEKAKASGIERSRNLAAISDPHLRRSAAQK